MVFPWFSHGFTMVFLLKVAGDDSNAQATTRMPAPRAANTESWQRFIPQIRSHHGITVEKNPMADDDVFIMGYYCQ
jgi:hypothetical protein